MDIEIIVNWCRLNTLRLNCSKCKMMSFTRRQEATFQYFNYDINGIILDGVKFYSKLTFEQHIYNIATKSYNMFGVFGRSLSKCAQLHAYKSLCFVCVQSLLEYYSSIWNLYYNTFNTSVEKARRIFTRFTFKKFYYTLYNLYSRKNQSHERYQVRKNVTSSKKNYYRRTITL